MSGSLLAARNVLKAWLLLLGICGALGAFGFALGGLRLSSIFVFSALLLAGGVLIAAERVAAGMVGGRELLPGEAAGLHSALERLSLRASVIKPRLYVIPEPFPRALSAGRGGRGSAIVLSSGFVAVSSPAELEGVLAHEVAHLRHRDVLVQTSVVVVASALLELSRVGGFLQRALLFVLGPVAAAFVHLLLSPKREFDADRVAAELCGSPHGLADALVRLDQASAVVGLDANPATEPLHTVSPFAGDSPAALFQTHPPVGERIARLRALDPRWRDKLRAA